MIMPGEVGIVERRLNLGPDTVSKVKCPRVQTLFFLTRSVDNLSSYFSVQQGLQTTLPADNFSMSLP